MNVRSCGSDSYVACGLFTSGSGALYGGRSGRRVAYVRMGVSDRRGSGGLMVCTLQECEALSATESTLGSNEDPKNR